MFFYFWHPMLVRPVMKRLFFALENQGKKGSLRWRASLQYKYSFGFRIFELLVLLEHELIEI